MQEVACQEVSPKPKMFAGHWKLKHTLKNLGIIQFNLVTQFLLFTFIRNAPGLFESFGFVRVKPAFIAFTLFSAVSAPLNEVTLSDLAHLAAKQCAATGYFAIRTSTSYSDHGHELLKPLQQKIQQRNSRLSCDRSSSYQS